MNKSNNNNNNNNNNSNNNNNNNNNNIVNKPASIKELLFHYILKRQRVSVFQF